MFEELAISGTAPTALQILSAMITPAVLILASGQVVLATSQRLGRIIERTRKLVEMVQRFDAAPEVGSAEEELSRHLFAQLASASRRARLLQRAMVCLYLALSIFVATSASLGFTALFAHAYTWLPIVLGLGGASLLFVATVLLIAESRYALAAVDNEMDFVGLLRRRIDPTAAEQSRLDLRNLLRQRKEKEGPEL